MTRVIVLSNVFVALLLSGMIAWQAIAERNHEVNYAFDHAANLAEVIAEQTNQTLAAVDLGIETVSELSFVRSAMGPATRSVLHRALEQRQSASVSTFAYFVLDAQGILVASSRTDTPEPIDLSHYPEFIIHRDNPDVGLFLGPPTNGSAGNAASACLSSAVARGKYSLTLVPCPGSE
jgi:hypothetical protein